MAAEIKKALGLEAKLIAGGRGIFDVVADGKLVFSKYKTGRFPATGEVSELIGNAKG